MVSSSLLLVSLQMFCKLCVCGVAGTRYWSSGMRTALTQWTCCSCWVSAVSQNSGLLASLPQQPGALPVHTIAFCGTARQQHVWTAICVVAVSGLQLFGSCLTVPCVCSRCCMCPGPTADEPDSSMQTLRDAYYFLQENGYINFGVVKGTQTHNGPSCAAEPRATPQPYCPACCSVPFWVVMW